MTLYLQIFRPLFIAFLLYLMGDAFFRWDGFSYYASFSEFLPSVALVSVLWSIMSILAALLLYLTLQIVKSFCRLIRRELSNEYLLFLIYVFIFILAPLLSLKVLVWKKLILSLQMKLIILMFISFLSIVITWLFRDRSEQWTKVLNNRITPLIGIFSLWLIVSIPLVIYHTWIKQADNSISLNTVRPLVADEKHQNIILVTFDALTAKDMSVYGYQRETTPFITQWSKSATLFTKAEAENNFTTPAVASLMTGKRLWTHQTYHILGSPPRKGRTENLPLMLKKNGYKTMAFVVNPVASVNSLRIAESFDVNVPPTELQKTAFWFSRGETVEFGYVDAFLYNLFGNKIRLYDWIVKGNFMLGRFLDLYPKNYSKLTVPPEEAFNKFLSSIENHSVSPFFAWIHVLPPHAYYLPPVPFKGIFGSSSQMKSRKRYDEFIRYCDEQFESFIKKLRENDLLKNTIIILSADHGESFEHGYFGHAGPHLYEQVTHVPLIVKEPGLNNGRIIDDVVEQIDIPATILDLAKVPVPAWMEGRSLVPLIRGDMLLSRPAFSMALVRNRSNGHDIVRGTIAVWMGDFKLIHYLETNKNLLYNLKNDPHELNNIFNKEHDVGQRLLNEIEINLNKANKNIRLEISMVNN